ncbi:MAG: tetratricopeptide repeat protein [Betaproteobacteria bacterium]
MLPGTGAALRTAAERALAGADVVEMIDIGYALIADRASDLAARLFRRATELAPGEPRAHNGLGVALAHTRRHPQAADAFARARELAPRWINPLINEAEERTLLGDNDAAERLWREAATLAPDDRRPAIGIAMALGQRGDLDAALPLATAAAAADPSNPRAWQVAGQLAEWAWRHDEALDAFRRMLDLVPQSSRAWTGIASALLATGRWDEGFDALEHRRYGVHAGRRFANVPAWDGRPLDGTLVVHTDQGYGDMLMQARFLAGLRDRVARIVVLLDGYGVRLAPLFVRIAGVDRVATSEAELASERVAACAALASLAFRARAAPPFLADRIPYVAPSDARRTAFADVVASPRTRVGVVWSVAPRDEIPYVAQLKSLPAAVVAGWMDAAPHVEWHSLQPGTGGDPAHHGLDATRLRFHGARLVDFDATAALANAMDVIVSADTAVAHLAGALGKPVWLVDRANCDWRWRVDLAAWYPSIRVFRQARMRDWSAPAGAVANALRDLPGA